MNKLSPHFRGFLVFVFLVVMTISLWGCVRQPAAVVLHGVCGQLGSATIIYSDGTYDIVTGNPTIEQRKALEQISEPEIVNFVSPLCGQKT